MMILFTLLGVLGVCALAVFLINVCAANEMHDPSGLMFFPTKFRISQNGYGTFEIEFKYLWMWFHWYNHRSGIPEGCYRDYEKAQKDLAAVLEKRKADRAKNIPVSEFVFKEVKLNSIDELAAVDPLEEIKKRKKQETPLPEFIERKTTSYQ